MGINGHFGGRDRAAWTDNDGVDRGPVSVVYLTKRHGQRRIGPQCGKLRTVRTLERVKRSAIAASLGHVVRRSPGAGNTPRAASL